MGRKLIGQGGPATIDRGRRCQNCLHWDCGERATQHYKASRHADLQAQAQKILAGEGVSAAALGQRLGDQEKKVLSQTDFEASMQKLGLNYDFGDSLLRAGALGICLVGGARGDFVHYAFLCDKWSERVRPDDADKPDELSEEAKERLGYDD